MGAHFRLPILQLDWETLAVVLAGLNVYHADMEGELSCWEANFRLPCALLIGSEAEGISPAAANLVTRSVRIPMAGKNESLNAAVSAGILLFEILRQRSAEGKQ
jgi:TrmH family RNA methyltransferase